MRPVSLAVVDQGGFVLDQMGLKIADQFEEALELVAGIRQPSILLQLAKHIPHGSRRLPDVAAPEEMTKPRHMKRSVSKVNTQIADALEPFPRLFDMTEPHRQMEPVENVGDGLAWSRL